ncbi:Lrp/AsnC ligand binding domain-containing protein [archaeon]|nr:Lrp/AsnC ligand binding domain-containing protein [archaeon]
MPQAFVLINTEVGAEDEVFEQLKRFSQVKEVYLVYGVYDIVARVEADTLDELKDIVTWRIRKIDKIKSTLTMLIAEK